MYIRNFFSSNVKETFSGFLLLITALIMDLFLITLKIQTSCRTFWFNYLSLGILSLQTVPLVPDGSETSSSTGSSFASFTSADSSAASSSP